MGLFRFAFGLALLGLLVLGMFFVGGVVAWGWFAEADYDLLKLPGVFESKALTGDEAAQNLHDKVVANRIVMEIELMRSAKSITPEDFNKTWSDYPDWAVELYAEKVRMNKKHQDSVRCCWGSVANACSWFDCKTLSYIE